ncbi:MAG TPA: ABC transporter permease, partial [Rhodocyclaceae bacterium]|nr:ABC transporter permease [Rhodocyclaceae bacterium]
MPSGFRPQRDPDALRRAGWALAALLVLWPILRVAEFNLADLFD